MSEKIYNSRDEKRASGKLRFWRDLLADLVDSRLREHPFAEPALIGAYPLKHPDDLPMFQCLESEPPRPGTLISGAILSLATFGAISILIVQGSKIRPAPFWNSHSRDSRSSFSSSSRSSSRPPSGNGEETSTASRGPVKDIASLDTGQDDAASVPSTNAPAQAAVTADKAQTDKAHTGHLILAEVVPLDAAERKRVIDGAVLNLKRYYDYPELGVTIAQSVLTHEQRGDYDAVTDGQSFAALLTGQMQELSHDRNLTMVYHPVKVEDRPPGPTPDGLARYRQALQENNCFFRKIEILTHNIGYLKLDSFPDPSICQPTAAAAMHSLNHTDAIIFDLRDNTGGFPKMVAFVASYLFNRPTHLNDIYNRDDGTDDTTVESWTLPAIPGNYLANKPAYILTSNTTFSGAEEFTYDLKMLKRATIVGESTSGRGHVPIGRRIDDHFEIRVPDRRPINPISKTDWDGPGVVPDVKVNAANALQAAVHLAMRRLKKK